MGLLLAGLLLCQGARAQFYQIGNDPSSLRWSQIETPAYRIIYPRGADSLARRYGTLLEQFRAPIGRSIGTEPGEGPKMPVVLHTQNPYANGMVLWAPRRMELFTLPDAYGADPTPWEIQLAAHEPRHQAQLQAATKRWMKPLGWLAGQAWAPVGWDLYMERPFGEGDAVAVETGLHSGTRARTADFLNYYQVALDQGPERNWFQWRYGSFKRYTPDVYTVGYMSMAGARYLGGKPQAAQEMWNLAYRKPWLIAPYNWRRTMGQKSANAAFRHVLDLFREVWQADADARAPFMPQERLSPQDRFPVEFSSPVFLDGILYLFREGYVRSKELVRYGDGAFQPVRPMAGHTSSLFPDETHQRLYWSETVRDPRWELSGSSIIRYWDARTGQVHDVTGPGKRYYNPQPSPDGSRLAVTEYPFNGGSALVLLDAGSGAVLARYPAPDGLQLTEQAWSGQTLFCLGVEEGGYGLYKLSADGAWETVLSPSAQKIVNLDADGDALQWVSDRDGSNELYTYLLQERRLVQETSARYGATDFAADENYLYYVALTLDGQAFFRTPQKALQPRDVPFYQTHTYQIEDALTAQETALGPLPALQQEVALSAPRPYRKAWQGMRLHSWLPAYVNADAVRSASFDWDYQTASLGLTGFFQNELGTLSGQLGYGLHQDPDDNSAWRNSLHAQLSWTGWWPVVEASLDFGDQAARRYTLAHLKDVPKGEERWSSVLGRRQAPLLDVALKAYLPLTFSKGGLLSGLTPQIQYHYTNNVYQQASVYLQKDFSFEGVSSGWQWTELRDGAQQWMQRLSASVRGYVMLPRAESQRFPRWGFGAEAGISLRPGLTGVFTPCVYGYTYAYLPGILREQGLRLTGVVQQQLGGGLIGDSAVSTVPQGFQGIVGQQLALSQPFQAKLSANYAVPLYFGDLAIGGIAYIRHFLLSPHADLSLFRDGHLWSAGADLTAELGRLLFVSFDTSVGVSFSYLGGSWYARSGQGKPYYIGFIFNIDI